MFSVKDLSKDKKAIMGIRFGLYLVGFVLCMLGGISFMASVFIFIAGFLVGKYLEKILSFIKDYRLAQKVNRISYTQLEVENMKKELDRYRDYFKQVPPARSTRDEERRVGGTKVPYDFDSVSFNPGEV